VEHHVTHLATNGESARRSAGAEPITERREYDRFQTDGIAGGRLLLQRCAACQRLQQPPRPMCGTCHGTDFEAVEASGLGFVYSWVVPRHGVPLDETHVVALVELDEGVRFVAEIVETAVEGVANGVEVEAVFRRGEALDGLAFRVLEAQPTEARKSRAAHPPYVIRQRDRDPRWRDTAIVGVGQTEYSKNSGRSELQLAAEASLAAIEDAGLDPADIDGMITYGVDTNAESALMECLGIPYVTWVGRPPGGGNISSAVVGMAAAAVVSGAATNVLIYRAFNERSGFRFGAPTIGALGSLGGAARHYLNNHAAKYALWYQRYMHTFGVTNEDLGRYTVVARRHAATNPNAWFYERPITLEDHQDSRWIVEPVLRLLDCCQESDGGAALVVTSRAQAKDLRQPAVVVEAAAQTHGAGATAGLNYHHGELSRYDEATLVAQSLYRDAGLTPADIDAAMLYENFTPVVFLMLEAHGFCAPGEAKRFIADGNIDLGGSLPVNTHGGLLGEAYLHGMNNAIEAVRQLRGTAANQLRDPEHVLVSVGTSGMILGRST
jgi:acetyl-CoA acetyltransferase/uncharacterized OB-fold protein